MRTFDHVDDKLLEADFFINKMSEEIGWFEMRCYFSAFVSSARSVTFALQASMNGVSGFEIWYSNIQADLRKNQLARFFHDCRTDNQKIGFNHIVGGSRQDGKTMYWFGKPERKSYKYIPEIDVLTACNKQMKTVCSIIDKTYVDFGLQIDPDQIYTPSGLAALNMSLEDIEESLGLPRGHTDIEWDGEDKHLQRLMHLRKQISGSSIKPLLKHYLKRDLEYPDGNFIV